MYKHYNPNEQNPSGSDCVIRALTKALNKSWDDVFLELCVYGFKYKEMPSVNSIWGFMLTDYGFSKFIIGNTCPNCYTVIDFTKDHDKGLYVLGMGDHVVTVLDGDYYDSWDSGTKVPIYYFTTTY
jgi:hypothetical protein